MFGAWAIQSKDRWKKFKVRLFGTDLFQQTQSKLTIQYSLVLIGFLLLFVLTVYGLLYYLLINDQKQQLSETVEQKIHDLHEQSEYNQDDDQRTSQDILLADTYQIGSVFVDANRSVLSGDSIYSNALLDIVNSADITLPDPNDNKVHYVEIATQAMLGNEKRRNMNNDMNTLSDNDPDRVTSNTLSDVNMIVAVQKVAFNNQSYGTLYVGKDVTVEYRLFRWLLIILIGIALIFCIIAVFLSYKMSARAMIPILTSYKRQREFVADASHELRTPLSVILSSIDTMEMEEAIEEDEFLQKILRNMKDEARRMIELSSSLLTLARTDSDTVQLQLSRLDLYPDAQRIVQSMQPLADQKQIELRLQAPEQMMVHADIERIKQLLVILLDNAIKYTPPQGHVTLSFQSHPEKNNFLQIKVQDTGIGIAVEDQARIFERFYRVDKSRTRHIGGHGLGLSIARWIVQAHGGTLTVNSQPDQGSTFIAEIPC